MESPRWRVGELRPEAFDSQWGAPFGARQVLVPAGQTIEIDLPGTDFSIAYVDRATGGLLQVEVDGRQALHTATNVPFETAAGESVYLENRRGIRGLPFGMHALRVSAAEHDVALLGVFSYDTRSHRRNERVLRGEAYPGETIVFSAPFKARPIVLATGALKAEKVSESAVQFTGDGPGGYEIVGE